MSLLGDLMHKCPPAEACRSAFERMSKATVQMCLSTTGFGSQVAAWRSNSLSSQSANSHPRVSNRLASEQRQQASRNAAKRAAQARTTSRPVPRFDMNLADLFGNNDSPPSEQQPNNAGAASSSAYTRPDYTSASAERPSSVVVPMDQTRNIYPPQRSNSMEYYTSPASPQNPQQQTYYYASSAHSASPTSLPAATYQPSQYNNEYATSTDQQQEATGIDYGSLESSRLPVGSESRGDYGNFAAPTTQPPLFPGFDGLGSEMGIDLGFGLSMDFQHDWSEGANYDLLEGFFFGGGPVGG